MALKRWAIHSFTVDTDTDLLEAGAGEETVIFSLLISNYEAENDATITVKHTDTDGTTAIFEWVLTKEVGESPTAISSVIVMEAGDKIVVQSDQTDVSILASGEAK